MSWVKNLDPHDQPGTHWIAIVRTPETVEYFDSFGRPPGPDIVGQMQGVAARVRKCSSIKINGKTPTHRDADITA